MITFENKFYYRCEARTADLWCLPTAPQPRPQKRLPKLIRLGWALQPLAVTWGKDLAPKMWNPEAPCTALLA